MSSTYSLLKLIASSFSRSSWSLLVCLAIFPLDSLYAQDDGYMTVRGKVEAEESPLSGAKVELIKNGTKIDETITKSGKYTFSELPISPEGDKYIIKISKPGHVTLKQQISTKAPAHRKTKYPEYRPTIELFKMVAEVEKEKALTAILNKPISKFGYNARRGDFEDDRAYFSTIKAKVDQLFDILEAEKQDQYKLLAEYRLKKMEEQKRKEEEAKAENVNLSFREKYDNSIAKADKAFANSKYEKAKDLYREIMISVAKSKLPKADRDELKKYPKSRIFEIETLIAEMAERGEEVEEVSEEIAEETSKDPEEEIEVDKPEEEDEAARLLREEEEAEALEMAQNQAMKAEKEAEITEALAARDKMLREQKEAILKKRMETEKRLVAEKLAAEAAVKAKVRDNEKIAQEKEVIKAKNMAVKSKEKQDILKIIAASTLEQKRKIAIADSKNMSANAANYPKISATPEKRHVKSFTTHYIKNVKDLNASVKLIHNRYKVSEMTAKEEKKAPAKEIAFKPKVIETVKEDMFKTINYTIIKYPVKPDTLQKVSYLWGATYYYQNSKEIDEPTYKKVIENL
ncbi:MAG TPA: hypothetical protein EYN69_02020 [Flavobacteriales bacterium]|nr:hypothetical protein [Flavobacteriales bacterium]